MSIRTDMARIRRCMGVCPQHDVLYPNLTVLEHLTIYGELKGLAGAALRESSMAIVREVGLTEKVHVKSRCAATNAARHAARRASLPACLPVGKIFCCCCC